MRVFHFTIPRLPSAELGPNARVHWYTRNRAMQQDKDDAAASFLEVYRRPTKLLERAKFNIKVIQKHTRRIDPDNTAARTKGFIDGLVGLVLVDDSAQVLREVIYQFTASKTAGPATVFTIEELRC